MAMVNSVSGLVDTEELGLTLPHEHVIETGAGIPQVYPEFVNRNESLQDAISQFRQAFEQGLRTIVDVTTMDLGRDVTFLRELSAQSGVKIICATGMWLDIPRAFARSTPDAIAGLFTREIWEGIEGTSIRAGIIKVATDNDTVTPREELVLRAAARAHRATGVPISTHTSPGTQGGVAQLEILVQEGVNPRNVYVGHIDDTDDMDYLTELAAQNATIGFDHFGWDLTPGALTWQERVENVVRLIEAGYADRIMLSHDWSVTCALLDSEALKNRGIQNPDGYLFVIRNVLPRLRQLGISEEIINLMTVDNPRRFFEGS